MCGGRLMNERRMPGSKEEGDAGARNPIRIRQASSFSGRPPRKRAIAPIGSTLSNATRCKETTPPVCVVNTTGRRKKAARHSMEGPR